jgi:hypothetical protein
MAIGLTVSLSTAEEKTYGNPLLNPDTLTSYVTLPKKMITILRLGMRQKKGSVH